MNMEQSREVIICPQCKGVGQAYRLSKTGTPYMAHGKPVLEICPLCDGEGRLLRITTIEYLQIPTHIVNSQDRNDKHNVLKKLKEKILKK